jgi:lipopolysaccharide transport system permease protein
MLDELRELWRFRYLLRMLVARELKVRYKNSVLGFAWSIVPPALSVVVISFFVKSGIGKDIPNYSAYLLCGIIPWTFFSVSVLETSQSLLTNYGIIKKIYMPREVIPLAIVISNFVHFVLGWAVYFAAYFVVAPLLHLGGTPFLPRMVWFPVIVVSELLLVTGCSLWSAALNMFYEDVRFVLQTLFGLVYFVFPILFIADVVRYTGPCRTNPWIYDVYMLNPVAALITAFRAALLEPVEPNLFNDKLTNAPPVPVAWWIYLGAFLIALFAAWSGYAYFNSRKWKFVERS